MTIRFAAILADKIIFVGKRHHNVVMTMHECGYKNINDYPQGFVTDKGTYVSREDAAIIALKNGQVKELKFSSRQLFSEDLY